MSGPGTWPLKAHTLAVRPGATSRSTSSMVIWILWSSAWTPGAMPSSSSAIDTANILILEFLFLAAHVAQVGDQRVDVVVAQVAAPGRHQHGLVDGFAAELDDLEQLLVGARGHLL